jgi:hypothetical protein
MLNIFRDFYIFITKERKTNSSRSVGGWDASDKIVT